MIREIGRELEQFLRAKGCPLPVVDGPEATGTTTWGRQRIVIQYDGEDAITRPTTQSLNPKLYYIINYGAKLTIYAQSRNAGAKLFEHRRVALQARDLLLVALDRVAAARSNSWVPKGGRFIVPEDLKDSEVQAGAVYEISFTFDRGVEDRTWDGEKYPEGSAAGLTHTTFINGIETECCGDE